MSNRISKLEIQDFCRTVCREMGETFVGPFSLEMDLRIGSMVLSLRGEKQWYRIRDGSDGLEILDNQGNFLNRLPGLSLPKCEKMEEFQIEAKIPACESVFADQPAAPTTGSSRAVVAPFSLKILPEMSQREILELIKAFLQASQGIVGTLHRKDNLFWLVLEIPAQSLPTMRLIVTSQISGKSEGEKQCQERVLLFRLFTRTFVPPDRRLFFLERINSYLNRSWAGSFRIHPDHEIEGGWSQNVLKGGIFVDYVWDAILRLLTGWKSLHSEIKAMEGGDAPS